MWRKENSPTVLVEINLVQPAWKTVWGFLRKLKMPIPLLGISRQNYWAGHNVHFSLRLILWKNLNKLFGWCWEILKAGGGGDNWGWDGWVASPTQWTWVWVNSRSWRWTGRPGVLWSMGLQKVGHHWVAWNELNHKSDSKKETNKATSIINSAYIFIYLFWKKASKSREC